MTEGIYVRVELEVPEEQQRAFRAAVLRAQHDLLVGVPRFKAIDMGDDDLLGCGVTVRGETTLEGALKHVRGLVDPARIERWSRVVDEGKDAVLIEERGALRRDADVADLLAHLRLGTEEGREHVEVTSEGGRITLRGVLGSYDEYRTYRMAIVYAARAAGAHGGTARVTFLGDSEGEFVALFVEVDGEAVEISEPDPQNLTEEDWEERLGGVAALDEAHAAWLKKRRKRANRRKR